MKIVKDSRTLNAISKKYNLVFDKRYKYCMSDYNFLTKIFYKNNQYKLKYFDGCFYPFLVLIEEN